MFSRAADNLRVHSKKCRRMLSISNRKSDENLPPIQELCTTNGSYSHEEHQQTNFGKIATPIAWSSLIGCLIYHKLSGDKDKYTDLQKLKKLFTKYDLTDFLQILISEENTMSSFLSKHLLMQGSESFVPKVSVSINNKYSNTTPVSSFDAPSSSSPPPSSSSPPPSSSSSSLPPSSSSSSSSHNHVRLEELQEELLQQQIRYQREIEKLEKENRELKRSLSTHEGLNKKKMQLTDKLRAITEQRSLIDMYSEILDCVTDYERAYNPQDGAGFHLPRIVVVGDQSSGKTSVLEMIVQARIFPRGSGEMMTRSPVQVTLSEGPFHVARLKDDIKNYNLTSETELEQLRNEIERRMKESIKDGQTVSNEVVSLSVQGPGLQRMVLVDLPGVISTVTSGMAVDTRDKIEAMIQHHMTNPNAIILCVQDGSVDAERSIVTDMVNSADPKGKRSIFVLTKVDLAESHLTNPDKIKQILTGKLFPMKALGYFAVVTGRGNSADDSIKMIKEYEQMFFKNSGLIKGGVLSAHQMGTMNMCMAVSQCFWQMVRDSVEHQVAAFEAKKFNLEAEWKNLFPKYREMDREELFEKARSDILDKVVDLSQISAKQWDDIISKNLWLQMSDHVFDDIYLSAAQFKNPGYFNTTVDIKLRDWAEKILCKKSLEIGQETLEQEFYKLMTSSSSSSSSGKGDDNDVFGSLRKEILQELKKHRKWDPEADNSLRVFQRSTLDDRSVPDKQQWDEAISFMKTTLQDRQKKGEQLMNNLLGPSYWRMWRSGTTDQLNRRVVKEELEKMFGNNADHPQSLNSDELIAIRKNLEARSVKVENNFIEETWRYIYQQQFYEKALINANDCVKGFYYYRNGIHDDSFDCSEVIMFWRVDRLLKNISKHIRQRIMNYETQRLEKVMKQILEQIGEDDLKVKHLLKGRRVELADEIHRVRFIIKLLEEFVQEFSKGRA